MKIETQNFKSISSQRQKNNQSSSFSSKSDSLLDKVPAQLRKKLINSKDVKRKNKRAGMGQWLNQFTGMVRNNKCSICLSVITDQAHSIADCNHLFCQHCLIQYLTFKIDSMEQVFCPNEGCDFKMNKNCEVFSNLPENYRSKYKKQQLWLQTMNNPDIKICPIETCDDGVVNLRKVPPKCQKCLAQFCIECMMAKHEGPCDSNFADNFKEWKRCPKCKMFIQKLQGCNHIVCRCANEFCFVCLSEWSGRHYSCKEQQDLQFFSSQERSYPKFLAFMMILGFPLAFIGVVLYIVVGLAFLIIIGVVGGLLVPIIQLGLLMIIVAPFTAVFSGLALPIYMLYAILIPSSYTFLRRYFITIKSLCRE